MFGFMTVETEEKRTHIIMNSTKVQNPRRNSYAVTGCRTPSDCIHYFAIRYTCAYKFTARVKSTAYIVYGRNAENEPVSRIKWPTTVRS